MIIYAYKILNFLISRPILKSRLKSVGNNFKFGYMSELRNPQYFSIGHNFYSGPYGYFVTNKHIPVFIGNNVMFGPFCKIFGGNHNIKFTEGHMIFAPEIEERSTEIRIEDGVWVGANSMILNNTLISEGSVIAAGGIVNSYVPPYCIAYGTPSKKFKRRFNDSDLQKVLHNVNSKYRFSDVISIYKEYNILDT